MKKLLCYLGILLLLCLAILPPVLRIFMPNQGEVEEEPVLNESILLSCKNDKYETSTNYENNKVQMIAIKKIKDTNESDLIDDGTRTNQENTDNVIENTEETELDRVFNSLKNANNIIYNDLEGAEVIGIDFSIYNHEDLDLEKLTKSHEKQKTYYESQGLTCTIRK